MAEATVWNEIAGDWRLLQEKVSRRVRNWTAEEWKMIRGKRDNLVDTMRRRYGTRKIAPHRQPSDIEKDQG